MITTNLKSRLPLMQRSVKALKKHEDKFSQKIMSVDMFPGGVPISWYDKFQKEGWQVLSKKVAPKASMILNQYNAVSHATSDMVLYTEDDILVKNLPKLTALEKLFNENIINGKKAGFICFNNHVYKNFNENPKHIIDFIHNLDNYVMIDDDVFMVKNKVIMDKYYLNFPVAITTKKMFLDLQDYAFIHKVGWGIEQAMTSTWFETGKDKDYEILISLKPEIIDDIKSGKRVTVLDFYNYANINFWNNDESLRHPETPGRREGCGI